MRTRIAGACSLTLAAIIAVVAQMGTTPKGWAGVPHQPVPGAKGSSHARRSSPDQWHR